MGLAARRARPRAAPPASRRAPRRIVAASRLERHRLLAAGAARQHRAACREVAGAELEAQRRAARLPLEVFRTRLHAIAEVGGGPDPRRRAARPRPPPPHRRSRRAPRRNARSGTTTTCHWASRGGQTMPRVVAVGHDQPADHPGRHAPRRAPDVVEPALGGLELDLERLGEVLAEVVGGAGLERLVVLHQRLAGVGPQRAGELLALGLAPGDHRHRHPLLHEAPVEPEDQERLLLRLRLGGVGGVALLPEELGGAQEEPGAHLPADHVAPLVDQQRQVAPALDPLGEHRVDDRLGGGPHHQRLLELLAAADG